MDQYESAQQSPADTLSELYRTNTVYYIWVLHVPRTENAVLCSLGQDETMFLLFQNDSSSLEQVDHVFYFICSCLSPLQQKISIPRSENPNELQTFTFYLSNVGRDNPQGSFDCIQQYISRWMHTETCMHTLHTLTLTLSLSPSIHTLQLLLSGHAKYV